MNSNREWDGARGIGPLRLGMSFDQACLALEVDDLRLEELLPEGDDLSCSFHSESADLRLSFYEDHLWSVSAFGEFMIGGVDLIGLELDELRALVGQLEIDPLGNSERDPAVDYVTYIGTSGLEFTMNEGRVVFVTLADIELIPED